jgi:hypothetical protein
MFCSLQICYWRQQQRLQFHSHHGKVCDRLRYIRYILILKLSMKADMSQWMLSSEGLSLQ